MEEGNGNGSTERHLFHDIPIMKNFVLFMRLYSDLTLEKGHA